MRRFSIVSSCVLLLEWAPSFVASFSISPLTGGAIQQQQQQQQQQKQQRSATRRTPTTVAADPVLLQATRTEMVVDENDTTTSSDDNNDASFSTFAASLEEEDVVVEQKPKQQEKTATTTTKKKKKKKTKAWQEDLEELLDPKTRPGERQAALQELLGANQDIRASVEKALKDRNIDPLLTPTGKKFQAGTRAVARQISSDILPSIAATARPGASSSTSSTSTNSDSSSTAGGGGLPPIIPPMTDMSLSKVGGRVFNALQNQFQKNVETLQGDLADPRRIPQRLSKQTNDIVKEATNVFSETPVGLKEPAYTVVSETDDYEVRDYERYIVASTQMDLGDSPVYRFDNVALTGAAFNSLAAYLFGANRDSTVMEMTTPVTTTLGGEMRFYLSNDDGDDIPEPLEQDESKSVYETDSISIEEIPPARLAVRRFTGFVTEGEVARQKEALLTALELDGVELDIPHGSTVAHVVFQYNPPYTIPVIRRNEIAVPVAGESSEVEEKLVKQSLEEPWDMSSGAGEGEDSSEDKIE